MADSLFSYDDVSQPPKYICYTIAWKVILNRKTAGTVTLEIALTNIHSVTLLLAHYQGLIANQPTVLPLHFSVLLNRFYQESHA